MNNIYSNSKTLLATAIVSFGLIFSGAALAGKDKPNKVNPGKPGEVTIVEAALATEGFERLVEALLCFGPPSDNPFIELLSGEDDYTVFAPSNAAFDNYFGEGVDPCTADRLPLHATVLQYHVIEG